MIKYLNPSYIFNLTGKILNLVKFFIIPILIVGLIFSLFLSPKDYIQGDVARIMYVHVPAAWISLLSFGTLSLLCIINFIFKIKSVTLVYKSLAPIGLTFNVIAIFTGSVWGQPTWGTWWAWDARLTSELILFFLYLSILLLHGSFEDKKKAASAVNILAIIGFINIPIIHFSVEWWNTLHQGPSVIKLSTPSIAGEMLTPLIITALGFTLFFFGTMLKSSQNILLDYEKNKLWVKSI